VQKMSRVTLKLKELFLEEDGPTATEYAVMLALIIVAALAAIGSLGQTVNSVFEGVNKELAGGTGWPTCDTSTKPVEWPRSSIAVAAFRIAVAPSSNHPAFPLPRAVGRSGCFY
jgi:pilus assembly protein Flp/PilA